MPIKSQNKTMEASDDKSLYIPCVCCLGEASEPSHAGLIRCSGCGHVRADLAWTPEMFRDLYTNTYFKGGEYADYEEEEPALRLNFRRRVEELAALHPEGSRLWEIGCAYGFFLKEASTHFSAAGCDVAEEAVRCAVEKQGVQAHYLNYLEYTSEQSFDIICMWDVIEHLAEPHRFLEKALAELRPGGTLALSTGDIGSLCARFRGARWRQIHPPTHVHYFTRESMTALLERLGYTDISFHYHAFWRNMDTVAEKVLAAGFLYRALHRLGLLHFNFPLNLYDLMTVYARKPE